MVKVMSKITDIYSNDDPTGRRDAQGEVSDEDFAALTKESKEMADVLAGRKTK
jgi:hypothetical protein